ncbi:MAG: MFS transporter [bacterium]|nr:MFS transporter [bacterium]
MAKFGQTFKEMGGKRAWTVIALGALFYMYQFSVRVSPNAMQDDIIVAFSIDAAIFGLIVGCYYVAYSGIQIPLGLLMDRFGPRRFMSGAGVLCGCACFLFASTTNPWVAGVARFMMGLGAACGFLGTLKLGTLWIPPKHIAKVIALTMAMGTTGALMGGAPLELLIDAIGWDQAFNVLGVFGLIIGLVIYIGVRDTPDGKNVPYQRIVDDNPFSGLKKVIRMPQAWIISGVGMMMYVPLTLFGVAWSKEFMMRVYSLGEGEALLWSSSMLFLGSAIGSPLFTALSDYMLRRRTPMMIGAVCALVVHSFICFSTGLPLYVMAILFFMAGFFYTSKCLCFASICEIMPNRSSGGVAIGFTNTIVMQTGVLFHPFIGYLLRWHWDGGTVWDERAQAMVPFYTEGDYRFAFIIIPICMAISILLIRFVKETHPGRHP